MYRYFDKFRSGTRFKAARPRIMYRESGRGYSGRLGGRVRRQCRVRPVGMTPGPDDLFFFFKTFLFFFFLVKTSGETYLRHRAGTPCFP